MNYRTQVTLILLILAIKEVLFLGHCTKCEKPGGNTIVSPENANVPSENGLYRPEMPLYCLKM